MSKFGKRARDRRRARNVHARLMRPGAQGLSDNPTEAERVAAKVAVAERVRRRRPHRTGRNERCPCLSGLKYKRCCLRLADKPSPPREPLTPDLSPAPGAGASTPHQENSDAQA